MNTASSPSMKSLGSHLAIALSLLVTATSCAQAPEPEEKASAAEANQITVDGSSTVYPITDEIAKEYQLLGTDKPEIIVDFSGTGGGFERFCAGETDISNASRPINKEEIAACEQAGIEYIELPVAYDAITVVVHPDNDRANEITLDELKKLWEPGAEGKITKWNQIRPEWPDRPIKLYGPGDDSGTFDYFTEAVVGESGASRTDYIDSEDDTVLVRGVVENPEALGYFGYAYYEENQATLKALAVDGGEGAVPPSPKTVKDGQYQPLSRPLFIYVNAESAQRPEVKEFIEYYLNHTRFLVKTVGYIPLPDELYNLGAKRLEEGKTGTLFGGEAQLDLTIEELLQKEAQ